MSCHASVISHRPPNQNCAVPVVSLCYTQKFTSIQRLCFVYRHIDHAYIEFTKFNEPISVLSLMHELAQVFAI